MGQYDPKENLPKGRKKSSFWTLLQQDEFTRSIIRAFIANTGKSMRQIGKETDIPYYRISNYLNKNNQGGINDLKIMKLCEYLGIKVEIKIEVLDDE